MTAVRSTRSRRIGAVLALALAAGTVLAAAGPARAVHDDDLFELGPAQGADILGDGIVANGPDWADIFDAGGNPVGLPTFGGVAASFVMDPLALGSAKDPTTFSGAGGSNKNNDQLGPQDCVAVGLPPGCDSWHWDEGNVPTKDDLSNVYAYATFDTSFDPPHLIIYSGFERISPEGDSHIDIEFFQDPVALDETPPCNDTGPDPTPCNFNGIRTDGDLIVSMDFVQGGGVGSVSIHSWDDTVDEYVQVGTSAGEGCNGADTICAFNNGGDIDGGPWPNFGDGGPPTNVLEQNAFTEIGVDVTALLGGSPCISTFMGKTRSSSSFTAELKDFAGPTGFNICNASIAIEPDDVNEVGEDHTFTVTVLKDIPGGADIPADDGTIVDVTLTDANGAVSDISSDTCASPGTVGGVCTITFTSDTAGTVTGHAAADVDVFGTIIHVETDGTGGNSGDAVKRFVDAFIAIAPDDVNEVGESHTFTVTVQQDDGGAAGFVDVPDGTLVTVTLSDSPDNVVDTCASPGTVGGECTVTFTSDTATTISGHAAVTLTVLGVSLLRETDGTGDNSGDATKVFVDAFITIAPDDVNEPGESHTFTVTVQQNVGGGAGFVDVPDGTVVTVTLSDDPDNVVDTCASPGTVGGECTVTFTSDTATTITGHAAVTLTVLGVTLVRETDGTGDNSGDATKVFVDAFITIAPDDVNSVGESHTFTVTVQQNDGSGTGFVDVPDGTIVTVTLTGSPDNVVDTCASPGTVGGECTVTFTSDTATTITGHAAVTLTIEGLTITRETDGTGQNSGDATKVFVAGSIRWSKVDNAGALQGGATFEVCRTHNFNTATGLFDDITPDVCVTVLDDTDGIVGPGLDRDPDPGEFLLVGLRLGRYTVDETAAPPGFEPDPDVVTVELTLATPDVVISEAFINNRPILKLTEFGYTNTPTGTPTAGVVSGVSVFTAKLQNFGGAAAALSGSLVLTGQSPDCDDTTLFSDASFTPGEVITVTATCTYTNAPDGTLVTATLDADYTLNGVTREASGSPATITFTIQAD